MKKLFLFGLILIATNAFSQKIENVPLNSDQQKQVKNINKEFQKQIDKIVENDKMDYNEKKSQVAKLKTDRDTQLKGMLLPEQLGTVEKDDGINWEKENKKIDKLESARLKAEMEAKIAVVQKDIDALDKPKQDLQKQIDDLKSKQKEIEKQQDALKDKQKEIKAQYKQ